MSSLFLFDLLYRKKYGTLAGLDEAGRGPLAGPVVAAAVIIEKDIEGVNDSKQLSSDERERLFTEISNSAKYGVGIATPEEIDILNILQATKLAMKRALKALGIAPDFLLIDGRKLEIGENSTCIIKGDSKSLSIAAASIIAKVIRDRLMKAYSKVYPQYGFHHNFGYPTPEHKQAIKKFGLTPFHRLTYMGVIENAPESLLYEWRKRGLISKDRFNSIMKKKKKLQKQEKLF